MTIYWCTKQEQARRATADPYGMTNKKTGTMSCCLSWLRLFADPVGEHLGEVFGVAAGEDHVAEAVAVFAGEAAVGFEPLDGLVLQGLGPLVGVVSGGVASSPDLAEVGGAVAGARVEG